MSAIRIERGYRPGLIGRCLELQALYYAEHIGFGQTFEYGRAHDIAAFFARMPHARSEVWYALDGDEIVATIAVDGHTFNDTSARESDEKSADASARDLGRDGAQLRWFITADVTRGTGIGRRLIADALAFCDHIGFARTHLWTFAGLDAARHLYETCGFVLVDEETSTEWGPPVLKQHFVRRAASEGRMLGA